MSAIQAKYSDEQRDAMGAAKHAGMKARDVIERAAAGTLELDGVPLPAFEVTSTSTVRDAKARYLRRRVGRARADAAAEPRDAIESLRDELLGMAQEEVRALKRQKAGTRDPERMRQIVRCLREAAAINGRDAPRPVAPGQRDPQTGEHAGGRTRGGIAGSILAAHHRSEEDPEQSFEAPPSEPDREPDRDAKPEPPDSMHEIGERLRRRLQPEPQAEPAAPKRQPWDTLPTAMSAPDQLEEAAERLGWDPLHAPPPAPRSRRGRPLEDDSSTYR